MSIFLRNQEIYAVAQKKGLALGYSRGYTGRYAEIFAKEYATGCVEGERCMSELNKYLITDRRSDELERATDDVKYRQQLYQQYGIA